MQVESMLYSHLNAVEQVLLKKSELAKNAGHPVLRGSPREWFIKEFLEGHLPSTLEIGQGEIINAYSEPHPSPDHYRNQVDIVIYRRDLPKITYSPSDSAFLIEGVVATLEIKSELEKGTRLRKDGTKGDLPQKGLHAACAASKLHKSLIPEWATGLHRLSGHELRRGNESWFASHILAYVVAFDTPCKSISTVAEWLPSIAHDLAAEPEQLIDMIVILGKGIVWRIDGFAFPVPEIPEGHKWAYIEQEENNLFALFTHLIAVRGITSHPSTSTAEYVSKFIDVIQSSGKNVQTVG